MYAASELNRLLKTCTILFLGVILNPQSTGLLCLKKQPHFTGLPLVAIRLGIPNDATLWKGRDTL